MAGAKGKYTKKIGLEIAELYGLGGALVQEICDRYAIHISTFYEWQKSKPEFSEAIDRFHAMRLQQLGKMALNGMALLLDKHEFTEEKTEYGVEKDQLTGKMKPVLISTTRTKKFVMPNARMVEFVASNRLSKDFKNTSHIDHTNNGSSFNFGSFLMAPKEVEEDVYVPDHKDDYVPDVPDIHE